MASSSPAVHNRPDPLHHVANWASTKYHVRSESSEPRSGGSTNSDESSPAKEGHGYSNSPSTTAEVQIPVERVIIAYGGVLCVVLKGLPQSLQDMKDALADSGVEGVCPENNGSKWAKITLAAPDAMRCKDVTPHQWESLRRALAEFSHADDEGRGASATTTNSSVVSSSLATVTFRYVTLVHFTNRTLEKRKDMMRIPIVNVSLLHVSEAAKRENAVNSPSTSPSTSPSSTITTQEVSPSSSSSPSTSAVKQQYYFSPVSMERGESVIREFASDETWPEYLNSGIASRLQTFEDYDSCRPGSTMVCFVNDCQNRPFQAFVRKLRWYLEVKKCGDWYRWFPEESLHMTVRGVA